MIDLAEIQRAASRIAGHVAATPLVHSAGLSGISGMAVSLKMEHMQPTGSFKIRGAANALLRLSPAQRERGVVAFSTGNHGRALAYAASTLGLQSTICMSSLVPRNKVEEIRRLGARVMIVGDSQDAAEEEVGRLIQREKLTLIPPFDHPDIVAGQGTIGLEIVQAMAGVASVIVPLSGGGLAAGVAVAVKTLRPGAKVYGVSMDHGAAMKASLDAGHPVRVPEYPSLADSLGGGIGEDNKLTFEMCRSLLDEVVLISEDEIAEGICHAYRSEREVLEGAGAIGISAVLSNRIRDIAGPVAIVLTGRNIDVDTHHKVVSDTSQPFELARRQPCH